MSKLLLKGTFVALSLVAVALIVATGRGITLAKSETVPTNPVWGTDIRVNPPNQDFSNGQRNLFLAVDPTNPNNVIGSYDNFRNNAPVTAFASSTDSGLTWSGGRINPINPGGLIPQDNAGVAYDASGTGYLGTAATSETTTQNGIFVFTYTNGILGSPVAVVNTINEDFHHQPSLTTDRRPQAQNVYAFWLLTNNTGSGFHGINMSYSHDSARTWSNPIQVSDAGNEFSNGPSSTVASNGTVYVAFQEQDDLAYTSTRRIYLDRSTDLGVTWGMDRVVGGGPITNVGIADYKLRELTLVGNDACSLIRLFHYPSISVSPNDPNTVYAVWNDGRWEQNISQCSRTGKHSDIAFSKSTDGGVTWNTPMRINDDPQGNGIDQFSPSIAARPDGVIGITWYDRRYDTANPYWYNMAYSQSTDGGNTWSPNTRVSDQSSNPDSLNDTKGIDELGPRRNFAYGPDFVLPAWQNAEPDSSKGDFYTDRGALPPNVTPTPPASTTSIRTLTATSTVTSTPTTAQASPTRTSTSQPSATGTAQVATSTRTATITSTITSTGTVVPETTATATMCSIAFSDVDQSNTFYTFIRCLACRGIISGYSDGTFRPGNEITRGQIAKMVSNAAGYVDDPGPQVFEDVPPDSAFYQWINRLSNRGYMGGYACGTIPEEPCIGPDNRPYFRPFSNATRGQLAKIVANTAGASGNPTDIFYTDVQPDNPFYLWIMRLTNLGAMSGYACGGPNEPCDDQQRPYFRPFNNVTRGQASKIVANTFLPDCQTPVRH